MRRRRRRKRWARILMLILVLLCGVLGIVYGMKMGKIKTNFMESTKEIPYQEEAVKSDTQTGKYYYGLLNEEEQKIYREIFSGVDENTEEIYVYASDADLVNRLFQYVVKDHPEIFWCDGTATATSYSGVESYTVLKPEYQHNPEERTQMQSEIDAAVSECLSGISSDASDYEKILYVYEYLVNQVEYDMDAPENQNIYSAFVKKASVCAGYSKATQYLLEKSGVFCTYVTGTTTDGQSHAWNLVKCEGDYCYVDTTWGDPLFLASEGEQVSDEEKITYDYMCCDDAELLKTHIPDTDVTLPSCTSMDWNYYVVNHMYHTDYDGEEILQQMNDIISQKSNPMVIKFANSELYEAAHEDIFSNLIPRAAKNLADWYGVSEVKYQYLDEAELNKITIFWRYE